MPTLPGVKDISFFSSIFSVGSPINIQLSSKYIDDLLAAKNDLKLKLVQYPGVYDVKDNYNTGI